jgi:spore maturation protein CgeB
LEGIDYDVFKPVEQVDEYKADISFIGTATSERIEYQEALQKAGYNVKFYGPHWNREIVNEEFAVICSSSKYMLSLNTHNNIPYYFSDRLMRYLSCGAPTFHLDATGTLNEFFENGKDVIYFSNVDDLLSKLSDTKYENAIRMGMNGRDKILHNHKWEDSASKMLYITKEYMNARTV